MKITIEKSLRITSVAVLIFRSFEAHIDHINDSETSDYKRLRDKNIPTRRNKKGFKGRNRRPLNC